jgi:hypothetical protein
VKVLSVILIFYVILLSSNPCCEEIRIISLNLAELDSGDHDDTCTDICSPFFSCGSCPGFNNPDILSSIEPKFVFLDSEESIFCPPVDLDYINQIWQPPKIS